MVVIMEIMMMKANDVKIYDNDGDNIALLAYEKTHQCTAKRKLDTRINLGNGSF